MLSTCAAGGGWGPGSQAADRSPGGRRKAGGKLAEGGGKTGAEEAFSQLSLCKPKAHKGNLCLT